MTVQVLFLFVCRKLKYETMFIMFPYVCIFLLRKSMITQLGCVLTALGVLFYFGHKFKNFRPAVSAYNSNELLLKCSYNFSRSWSKVPSESVWCLQPPPPKSDGLNIKWWEKGRLEMNRSIAPSIQYKPWLHICHNEWNGYSGVLAVCTHFLELSR